MNLARPIGLDVLDYEKQMGGQMSMKRPGWPMVLVAVAVSAAVAGGGLARATHADSNELHACAQSNNGAMRLVSDPDTCHRGEQSVSWNVFGPTGPRGAPGPPAEVASDGGVQVTVTDSTPIDVAVVTVNADASSGGVVIVTSTLTAGTAHASGCPCAIVSSVHQDGGGSGGLAVGVVDDEATERFGAAYDNVTGNAVFEIAAGGTATYRLRVEVQDSDFSTMDIVGQLTAIYLPTP